MNAIPDTLPTATLPHPPSTGVPAPESYAIPESPVRVEDKPADTSAMVMSLANHIRVLRRCHILHPRESRRLSPTRSRRVRQRLKISQPTPRLWS